MVMENRPAFRRAERCPAAWICADTGSDHKEVSMDPRTYLDMLHIAERLKDTMRHCTTTQGRRESVAEHSWRVALMAFFLKGEFPTLDMDRVICMCLIHDLGECFTGDIPTFLKTESDRETEGDLLLRWVRSLPEPVRSDMTALYAEMDAQETAESKVCKALDKLEAVIQHNESPLATWEAHEYDLNRTYAFDRTAFDPWLAALRREILRDTEEKIANEGGSAP